MESVSVACWFDGQAGLRQFARDATPLTKSASGCAVAFTATMLSPTG